MAQAAAQVYASSFFELMEEENKTGQALEELHAIAGLFAAYPDYLRFLSSPLVDKHERCKRLGELLQGRVEPYTINFLKLLVEKGRIFLWGEIVQQYQRQYDQKNNIERAEVVTAIPMNDELSKKLLKKLELITGKTVLASYRVDPAILGGVVVKFENEQFDSSVRSHLELMKKQLAQLIV